MLVFVLRCLEVLELALLARDTEIQRRALGVGTCWRLVRAGCSTWLCRGRRAFAQDRGSLESRRIVFRFSVHHLLL